MHQRLQRPQSAPEPPVEVMTPKSEAGHTEVKEATTGVPHGFMEFYSTACLGGTGTYVFF